MVKLVYQSPNDPDANGYSKRFGYSRGIRTGPMIVISGTTSLTNAGEVQFSGDAFSQTCSALNEVCKAIAALTAEVLKSNPLIDIRQYITRVKLYVSNAEDCEAVGRGMKDVLDGAEYTATMIVGAKFVRPEMLVEIEVDAYVM